MKVIFDNEEYDVEPDIEWVAHDEKCVYPLYVTTTNYLYGICLGRVRFILNNNNEVEVKFSPLFSAANKDNKTYSLIELAKLKNYSDMYVDYKSKNT